jgi:hypothetical protein
MVKVCKPDGEGTIAGTRGNGEDAPRAAVLGPETEPRRSDPKAVFST